MPSIETVVGDLVRGTAELEGQMKRRVVLVGDDSARITALTNALLKSDCGDKFEITRLGKNENVDAGFTLTKDDIVFDQGEFLEHVNLNDLVGLRSEPIKLELTTHLPDFDPHCFNKGKIYPDRGSSWTKRSPTSSKAKKKASKLARRKNR
jgi:hypothetical protein